MGVRIVRLMGRGVPGGTPNRWGEAAVLMRSVGRDGGVVLEGGGLTGLGCVCGGGP